MLPALKATEEIATVVIAVYVSFIGTLQWITARQKLRLDLYNRRFDVYLATLDFMQALTMWSSISTEERRPKRIAFIRAVRESRFLFADNLRILDLLEEVDKRSFKVTGYIEELSQYMRIMPNETLGAYKDKESSLEWIAGSIDQLETLLVPYLAFGQGAFREWRLRRRSRRTTRR
jgi:hypothetical protein